MKSNPDNALTLDELRKHYREDPLYAMSDETYRSHVFRLLEIIDKYEEVMEVDQQIIAKLKSLLATYETALEIERERKEM